jgi:hypothetical protein
MIAGAATAIGVFEANTDKDADVRMDLEYMLPAAIGNLLGVMFLVYLTASIPTRSTAYKLVVIFILMAGLFIEIYLTVFVETWPESIATYIVVVLNFLLRTFYILEYVQDEWAPVTWAVNSVTKAVMPPSAPSAKPPPVSDDKADRMKEILSKWDSVRSKIEKSPKGLKSDTSREAWRNIVKPSFESGTLTLEKIKEAVATLRHADDSKVSLTEFPVGGRRRV